MFDGCRPSEAHHAAALRHAEHYLVVLKRADRLAVKNGGPILDAVALLEDEWRSIEAAHSWLLSAKGKTRRIAELISHYAYHAGNLFEQVHSPDLRIRWFAAARDSALELGDLTQLGRHLENLAVAHAAAGSAAAAVTLYNERIELAQRMADEDGEATAQCNLGTLLKDRGRLNEALEHMERSLELDRKNGNVRRECESLAAIGTVYFTMGDAAAALGYFETAANMPESHVHASLRGPIVGNAANCCVELGQRDRARELYHERIRLAREIRDNRGLALGLANWALLISSEAPCEAAKACGEALALGIDEPRTRGYVLDTYGVALRRSGDLPAARGAFDEARRLAYEANDMMLLVRILGHVAYLLAMQGETDSATATYEEQRSFAHQAQAKRPEASALDALSQIYYQKGDRSRATVCAARALELLQEARLPDADVIQRRLDEWRRIETASSAEGGEPCL